LQIGRTGVCRVEFVHVRKATRLSRLLQLSQISQHSSTIMAKMANLGSVGTTCAVLRRRPRVRAEKRSEGSVR
jgi:hypothetical protein